MVWKLALRWVLPYKRTGRTFENIHVVASVKVYPNSYLAYRSAIDHSYRYWIPLDVLEKYEEFYKEGFKTPELKQIIGNLLEKSPKLLE